MNVMGTSLRCSTILCSCLFLLLSQQQALSFVVAPSTTNGGSKVRQNRALSPSAMSALPDNVKAVIFDIDGTLSDSFRLGFDATREVLKRNGIPDITEAEYHDFTRYATPPRMARHAGVLPEDDNYEEVSTRLGNEFDDLYIGLVTLETTRFYDGIKEMILDIPHNVQVGALTNAAHLYAHAVLKANDCAGDNLYERFSSIRGADDVPAPKPAPDGLQVVCKDMGGVDPADCVYVGDSPSDGAAAKNAGMMAIGVLWGSHSEEKVRAGPFDYICTNVQELTQLLPQMA